MKIERLESDIEVEKRQKESFELVLKEEKHANEELIRMVERLEQQLDGFK